MLRPLEQVPNRSDGVPPDDRDRRARAEAALYSGEPSFRLIVDTAPALIAAMMPVGRAELVKRHAPSDTWQLPGLYGFDLQRRLIARPRPMPIVFASSHDDAVMRRMYSAQVPIAFPMMASDNNTQLDALRRAIR